MKVDIREVAEFLARCQIEYPFVSSWPNNTHDSTVLWEALLEHYFKRQKELKDVRTDSK